MWWISNILIADRSKKLDQVFIAVFGFADCSVHAEYGFWLNKKMLFYYSIYLCHGEYFFF